MTNHPYTAPMIFTPSADGCPDLTPFVNSRTPDLIFGDGSSDRIRDVCGVRGWTDIAAIVGGHSLKASGKWPVVAALGPLVKDRVFHVSGEPSPGTVDQITSQLRENPPDAIIAIGGGSVVDCGKAVAGMVPVDGSVRDYLEGVGTKPPPGIRLGCLAVPTTSGTGSEATKNAVISETGPGGFKKSLRHEAYVPDIALIDPTLITSCPPQITAASGMDAVCQLIEAYVSVNANPVTDALAQSGLRYAAESLNRAYTDGKDAVARAGMAYAAYLSGICLANAGLGVVHGIASPAGAIRDVPHGVVCGSLLPGATRRTVQRLAEGSPGYRKYAQVGRVLSGMYGAEDAQAVSLLIDTLYVWIDEFSIPGLSDYHFTNDDLITISKQSGSKNAPAALSQEEILQLLKERM